MIKQLKLFVKQNEKSRYITDLAHQIKNKGANIVVAPYGDSPTLWIDDVRCEFGFSKVVDILEKFLTELNTKEYKSTDYK